MQEYIREADILWKPLFVFAPSEEDTYFSQFFPNKMA